MQAFAPGGQVARDLSHGRPMDSQCQLVVASGFLPAKELHTLQACFYQQNLSHTHSVVTLTHHAPHHSQSPPTLSIPAYASHVRHSYVHPSFPHMVLKEDRRPGLQGSGMTPNR